MRLQSHVHVVCVLVILAGAGFASGARLLLAKTKATAGLTNQDGFVHSNGMWTEYQVQAPVKDPAYKPIGALAVANGKDNDVRMKQVAGKNKVTIATTTLPSNKATAAKGKANAKVVPKVASKYAVSMPGAAYTPAAADSPSSVKDNKSRVPGMAHSGCTSANGAGCSSHQLALVPHEGGGKKLDLNKIDVDKALKVAILNDADAAASAYALCHQGPFGALALSKAIALAILGDANASGRAVAVGLDADALAAASAIAAAIWGDADARGYAKALSYNGDAAKASSKSVAEAIYGDALANDFAVAVAENGGNARAKSEAASKAKHGAASSLSGATSRAEDGGNAVANSKAKAKAKGGPAWTAANSVASNNGQGSASAAASQDNRAWGFFPDNTLGVASSIATLN